MIRSRFSRDTRLRVFVKSMGGGQVNTVTGDLFCSDRGLFDPRWKTRRADPRGDAVGNGPKALSIVDRVGNDLGFATGTCGKDGQGAPVTDAQPTLRIPELTVVEVPMTDYWKSAT